MGGRGRAREHWQARVGLRDSAETGAGKAREKGKKAENEGERKER